MELNAVGVVGAGLMGRGIAQVLATSGYRVYLFDANRDALDTALMYIGQRLASLARKAKINFEDPEVILSRIHSCVDMSLLSEVDMVIEAVPERLEIKQDVFKKLSKICNPTAILATNTSGLSITAIASVTDRPERVVGMHFFHPVHVMQLVEIARGAKTEDGVVDAVQRVVKRIHKTAIEVKEAPLFVVNRILVPMMNEAIFVYQEGLASAEDIDTGMRLGANHPIGPLALADMVGLDTLLDTALTLLEETGDTKYRPPQLLRQMVRAGLLGRKSGQGFYRYDD